MTDNEDTVEIREWVKRGIMLVNTYALDIDDPDFPYNQIIAQGKRPEDYGMKHPYTEEFEDKSKEQIIEEILLLRKEVELLHKASAAGWI